MKLVHYIPEFAALQKYSNHRIKCENISDDRVGRGTPHFQGYDF